MSKKGVRVDTSKVYNLFEATIYIDDKPDSYSTTGTSKRYTFMAFDWASAAAHAEEICENLRNKNDGKHEVRFTNLAHKGEGFISYDVVESIVRYNEGKE